MSRFKTFWTNHPGTGFVCDNKVFKNQCAMRVGHALRKMSVKLTGLKTCVGYDAKKFKSHAPGHIRSAQQLANHFYRKPKAHGLGASSFKIYTGSMQTNMNALKDKQGMIFIMNGWGSTDHIDAWKGNGKTGQLKGGYSSYFSVGTQVWLWEIA